MENLKLLQKIVHDQVLLKIWSIHLRNIMPSFDPKKLEIIKDIFATINLSRGLYVCLFNQHTKTQLFPSRHSSPPETGNLPCSSAPSRASTDRSPLRLTLSLLFHVFASPHPPGGADPPRGPEEWHGGPADWTERCREPSSQDPALPRSAASSAQSGPSDSG